MKLPLLDTHRASLELCTYCPKLCRAACPVSNAEPREVLIPWGKMSTSYLVARGDLEVNASRAATAWACTGCYGCREMCDHHNEVASTLTAARADYLAQGAAPVEVREVISGWRDHNRATADSIDSLADGSREIISSSGVPVLLGCSYARDLPDEANHALRAVAALIGGPVRPVKKCCGQPLRDAGDARGFAEARSALLKDVEQAEMLVVVDPGCAMTLRDVARKTVTLVELAAASLDRLSPTRVDRAGSVRFHDPCKLGRGLRLFREPRAILHRVTGSPPLEFPFSKEHGGCSGGGGLLPVTMPETAKTIASSRVDEHNASGGGEIVTACASSLRSFRRAGAQASDLSTWIASGLGLTP